MKKLFSLCLALCMVCLLTGCLMRGDPGEGGGSAYKGDMSTELDISGDSSGNSHFISGNGSISIGGDGSISIGGDGSITIGDGDYVISDGYIVSGDGNVIGKVEVEEDPYVGEEEEEKKEEEDPYAGMVWVPVGTYVPEDQVVTSEDGTCWIKFEDEYYCVHEDGSFTNVCFYTEEYEKTTRENAQRIVLYVYLSSETGWTALSHAEYNADETCIFSTVYTLEETDGVLRYISSETTSYDSGREYVSSKEEYDPSLGMYFPIKIYTFDANGNPDGHFEKDYYTGGTTKASRGYYPNGNPSYDYRYNEAGIMVEEFWYNEQGILNGHNTYDDNGTHTFSTYYQEDGSYHTVENLGNANRFTFYDAAGNVTQTYDEAN